MRIEKFIFIIDHEKSNIFPLMMAISGMKKGIGCVDHASGMQEAFEKLPALWYTPSLIIINNNLPETNGMQILKRLKIHSKLKTIPVLLNNVSGKEITEEEGFKAKALGAEDYTAVHAYSLKSKLDAFLNKITDIAFREEKRL
ncbi:MAG TPA: response regulator [Bacteroidia bacterium]|nr:response regulator [Bacteroidia bacterium]